MWKVSLIRTVVRVCAHADFGADKSDEDWPQMNFVSGHALAEAEEVREQLQRLMGKFELELVSTTGTERKSRQSILRALVCGLFMQVARREGNSYRTIKENQFAELHPSCQLNEGHEWVLFDEFIFTGRSYLRTVSEVSLEWYGALFFQVVKPL